MGYAGVCGGCPCVGNTRIPVRLIVEFYRYLQNLEQIRDVLAWYEAHPGRVVEDIEHNARSWAKLQSGPRMS